MCWPETSSVRGSAVLDELPFWVIRADQLIPERRAFSARTAGNPARRGPLSSRTTPANRKFPQRVVPLEAVVIVIIDLETRRIVHIAVTRSPTDVWVAQQLREATPWGQGPKYLIHDRDKKYGKQFTSVARSTGIEELGTPYRAPKANAICERLSWPKMLIRSKGSVERRRQSDRFGKPRRRTSGFCVGQRAFRWSGA